MSVYEIIKALPHNISWTLVREDYNSDCIGTTIGTVQYSTILYYPNCLDAKINKGLDSMAVSVDLIENVIFYTEEEISK